MHLWPGSGYRSVPWRNPQENPGLAGKRKSSLKYKVRNKKHGSMYLGYSMPCFAVPDGSYAGVSLYGSVSIPPRT